MAVVNISGAGVHIYGGCYCCCSCCCCCCWWFRRGVTGIWNCGFSALRNSCVICRCKNDLVVDRSLFMHVVQLSKKASSAVFGEESVSYFSNSSLALVLCLIRVIRVLYILFGSSGCLRFLLLELLVRCRRCGGAAGRCTGSRPPASVSSWVASHWREKAPAWQKKFVNC